MTDSSPPRGYARVSPYLISPDAEATIAFLVGALDGEPLRRFEDDGGRLLHAEVRLDDSVVMLAQGADGEATAAHVHVYVADVDAAYERALGAGATSLQAPVQKDDPDRRAGVRDPGGTTWWLATTVG